ncbi:transposase, partial [Xanthomonas citri]
RSSSRGDFLSGNPNHGYTKFCTRSCEAAFFIAAKRSTIQAIGNKRERAGAERWEHFKASVRAKVEHPFRVIKHQFGYTKVRYRGLAKNTAQVLTLFALSNLWMKRKQLLSAAGSVRL